MKEKTNCTICQKKLSGKQTMFCSNKCKNKNHQSYAAQKKRGLLRKLQIVGEFGGKCSICGYNKNLAALTFHHRNPKEKAFKLDVRSLSNRRTERIQEELQKCDLLCHNCHAEVHNPQYNLESLSSSRLL